jgi:predicted DNA-binding transcriptional regulator
MLKKFSIIIYLLLVRFTIYNVFEKGFDFSISQYFQLENVQSFSKYVIFFHNVLYLSIFFQICNLLS